MDLRLRLEANSWIEALKSGLSKIGDGETLSENILCDIKNDKSIHVTDTTTGNVFQITEIHKDSPAPPASAPRAEPKPVPKSPGPAPAARPTKQPASTPGAPGPSGIGRSIDLNADPTADMLEEIFEKSSQLDKKTQKDALYAMLDLAMEKIGTDAGTAFIADINSDDISFAAARGPHSDKLIGIKLKVGQGIVGFCVDVGVGVAVSDASRDPRFYAAISKKIGYPTQSILCVPMQADEQIVGALELINKKDDSSFSENDLSIASFIGQQLARTLLQRKK
jgi:hypothetical protein